MKVIRYSNIITPNTTNIMITDNDNDIEYDSDINIHINSLIKKEYRNETKKNIFPDKYIYKHDWLSSGYKTTYKKDYIKHNKTQ